MNDLWRRWPYWTSITQPLNWHNQGWSPCVEWCKEQFGHNGDSWRYVGEGIFEFEREQDRTLFLLKWEGR